MQPLEGADESLLREVLRELVVARHPVRQSVDAIYVRVVQLALGGAVPGADAGYDLSFVHGTPERRARRWTIGSTRRVGERLQQRLHPPPPDHRKEHGCQTVAPQALPALAALQRPTSPQRH